ncbi:MAG: cytochrome P450 [Chloroflexota bacterium]
MIPGPSSRFGAIGVYAHLIDFFRRPIDTMRQYQQTYGDMSAVLSASEEGTSSFYFAFGADYNRAVFSKPQYYHSSAMLDIKDDSVRRLGNGLTFMNGDEHLGKRRLIMPAFHKKYIESYRDDMVALTNTMLDSWSVGGVVDINRACHDLTAKIAIKTLFGLDADREGEAMSHLIMQWMTLATSPALRIITLDMPFSPVRKMRKLSHTLESHFYELIARKRPTAAQDSDVLATLMHTVDEDGNMLSDDDLIGQVNVLFLAGHETSANALTWTLFLLSQHPDIYRNVRDELAGVLGGDAPTIEQLGKLPYLEAVINESMRVLPPVVWIQRIAAQDVELGEHTLGEGSTLILSHFMTHHNADVYPNPRQFDPSRWDDWKPAPYEYMAFSAGPRMCIGAGFAMMEMKIALAMILQRYTLNLVPNAQIDRHVTVTLSPKDGIPMRVKRADEAMQVHPAGGDIRELVTL